MRESQLAEGDAEAQSEQAEWDGDVCLGDPTVDDYNNLETGDYINIDHAKDQLSVRRFGSNYVLSGSPMTVTSKTYDKEFPFVDGEVVEVTHHGIFRFEEMPESIPGHEGEVKEWDVAEELHCALWENAGVCVDDFRIYENGVIRFDLENITKGDPYTVKFRLIE